MSRFKFVNIVDSLFISVVIFFIIFAWIQFFVKNILLSLFLSAIFSSLAILFIRWLKAKKYTSTQNKLTQSSKLASFKIAIQSMPHQKLITLIKKLIPAEYNPKTIKGDISFVKNNSSTIFTFYYLGELNDIMLLNIIKNKTADKFVIFCSNFNQEADIIARSLKNKNIDIINLEQLYEIFNKNNISVDTGHIDLNKHKITLKGILKNSISRNKSKSYFVSGLVLLLTSLIVPFKLYYVIISSILFVLSLLCRLKPTIKTNKSIFD